jgi:hypothetical protein
MLKAVPTFKAIPRLGVPTARPRLFGGAKADMGIIQR